jgi:hypothetical protein
MKEFLRGVGRDVAIVNLDPANDHTHADIDIRELIVVDEVMERLSLGPNGALIYCIEFLEENISWLQEKVESRPERYFLVDAPGQIELFTHHKSFSNILHRMQKDWKFQVCAVNMVDSHYCSDASKFISVLLTSLTMMLHLETPHVNVLSKIDLIQSLGPLQLRLDAYTDVLDMSYLLNLLDDDPFAQRYAALNAALTGLVEDFNLVSFSTLNVSDKQSMAALLAIVDKALAYIHTEEDGGRIFDTFTAAYGSMPEHMREAHLASEKYL